MMPLEFQTLTDILSKGKKKSAGGIASRVFQRFRLTLQRSIKYP